MDCWTKTNINKEGEEGNETMTKAYYVRPTLNGVGRIKSFPPQVWWEAYEGGFVVIEEVFSKLSSEDYYEASVLGEYALVDECPKCGVFESTNTSIEEGICPKCGQILS